MTSLLLSVIPGFSLLSFPRKRGPKATPTGGPERSERVSVAHNPKCRDPQNNKDFFPLDLRVKPEDDKGGEIPAGPADDRQE